MAGPIVVDASIAFLWFANEPDRWGAERLLETEVPLLAPDLMVVEATNAWWKKHRCREMDTVDVEQAVTNLLAVGISPDVLG
jgi:predicted nucleic acid-binding protein